jgi:CTP:molybdopterin cytidylyltransferase MocA
MTGVGYRRHVVDHPRSLCGLVLAAGAGSRYGRPKALARAEDGTPWVELAVRTMRDAGCEHVLVTLGASADEAVPLVPADAQIVLVADWPEGLSASLRAGLDAASALPVDALVITPVDTPAATAGAAIRVLERAGGTVRSVLVRAVYAGRPGHPAVIGRAHWAALRETLAGDSGAGRYLTAHAALEVECGDLWSGADVDRG